MSKRISVIGAGHCGLSQLRAFQQARSKGADVPEIVCFERQSDWVGRIEFPSREEMEEDAAQWQAREEALRNPMEDIDFQTDYCKDLSAATDYAIDWGVQSDNFKAWEHHKDEDIATYRDHPHVSPVTGTKAPAHHTKWWEAMDDSMETFMNGG